MLCRDNGKTRTLWIVFIAILSVGLTILFLARSATGEKTVSVEAKNGDPYGRLIGRWVRPDGGYVIEIKNISPDGTVECSYFNPDPIHVSKAQTAMEGQNIKLFMELQDVGYPGCTYHLTYEPRRDMLFGVYYQAAVQQSFEILFNRIR
jgi:hypothetical protein